MLNISHIANRLRAAALRMALMAIALLGACLAGCVRQPPLYLHEDKDVEVEVPMVELELDVYWDYYFEYGAHYDWREEWYYGWDNLDRQIFGDIGYHEPQVFQIRRYHTGQVAGAPHTSVLSDIVYTKRYEAKYSWGFWDILVWNEIETPDGVQSLQIDESSSLDHVLAYTNETMSVAHYNPSRSHSFYQPEELFAAYQTAIDINESMEGFVYYPDRNIWIKKLDMVLEPITYIYLPQIILHNNNGKIANVDGSGNLSGMARTVKINTGVTGSEPITVYHNVRLKKHCDMKGEDVDIIGGRMLTFGMCNLNANRLGRAITRVDDGQRHYLDVTMQFNNGRDSTFVFDVTDKVQRFYKGGVLTIELDCDTIPVPSNKGSGSGFNASIEDVQDGGTHEIEM